LFRPKYRVVNLRRVRLANFQQTTPGNPITNDASAVDVQATGASSTSLVADPHGVVLRQLEQPVDPPVMCKKVKRGDWVAEIGPIWCSICDL
jgi:hypothetical protein